jgi:BlaI family penicillinase repressor
MSNQNRQLSRRERQIMEAIFARGETSAAEVHEALPDAPSYSAIRALLAILERKGHLKHRAEDKRYIYFPTQSHESAARSALRRLLDTFYAGSAERAMAAMLDSRDTRLSAEELGRLEEMLKKARREKSK